MENQLLLQISKEISIDFMIIILLTLFVLFFSINYNCFSSDL